MSTHDPTKDIKRYRKDINTLKLIPNNDTPSPDETSLVFEHSVHNEIEKCSRVVFFECVGKREGGEDYLRLSTMQRTAGLYP